MTVACPENYNKSPLVKSGNSKPARGLSRAPGPAMEATKNMALLISCRTGASVPLTVSTVTAAGTPGAP